MKNISINAVVFFAFAKRNRFGGKYMEHTKLGESDLSVSGICMGFGDYNTKSMLSLVSMKKLRRNFHE